VTEYCLIPFWEISYQLTSERRCLSFGLFLGCLYSVDVHSVKDVKTYKKHRSSVQFATWNSIPISSKNCSSLYSSKHHLKSYFIAQLTNN